MAEKYLLKSDTEAYYRMKQISREIERLQNSITARYNERMKQEVILPIIGSWVEEQASRPNAAIFKNKGGILTVEYHKHESVEIENFVCEFGNVVYPFYDAYNKAAKWKEENIRDNIVPVVFTKLNRYINSNKRLPNILTLLVNFPELQSFFEFSEGVKYPKLTKANYIRDKILINYTREDEKNDKEKLQMLFTLLNL
jgi:hypothetical protein